MAFSLPIFLRPTVGLQPHPHVHIVTCATAVAVGDLLAVSNTPDVTSGLLKTVATPATADFSVGSNAFTNKFFCVALEAAAAGGSFQAMFSGMCVMLCAASQTAGNFLRPTDATRQGTIITTGAVGQGFQVVAQARFTDALGAGLKEVYFDGLGGFFRVMTNTT